MRFKFGFVLGAAAGFFAGAKIGQEALEIVNDLVSGVKGSTKTANRLVTVRGAQAAGDSRNTRPSSVITDITPVNSHQPVPPQAAGVSVDDKPISVSGPAEGDMDPSDLQFGRASMQKAELVDEAIATGTVDQLIDEGTEPRPGNKADVPRS